MRVVIESLPESGYRWTLEAGPGHCLLESGRASDVFACVREAQDAEAELGLGLIFNLNGEADPTGNLLTHPRFQA